MGHYYSEMEGPPFESHKELRISDGERLMGAKKTLKFSKVTGCKLEWITQSPHRRWIIVHYERDDTSTRYMSVFSIEEAEKYGVYV